MLPLLDVLVRSTTDKFSDDVATRSRGALSRFSEQRLVTGARPLVDALEENVFNLATQLPNHMSLPGDKGLLVITTGHSIAKSVECFQRRLFMCLFVCLFVCQHDNFRTSKRRMMKFGL